MKIAFLPIDDRPVCYSLPKLITQIDSDIELIMPERALLGNLEKSANVEKLFLWLENLTDVESLVIALDTIAYGGLIPSRRSPLTFEEIATRLEKLRKILANKKVYAFSSIMRISNNNINVEEKSYWDEYGKKIFEFSQNFHKSALNIPTSQNPQIPAEILNDYLQTRNRNFEINKIYLNWQKNGLFDTLIFSKDDCAQFGINVMESIELERLGATIKTGADEIPLTLLAKAVGGSFNIAPNFLENDHIDLISNYEDIPIKTCVQNQIELAGCKLADSDENSDLILLINNFKNHQGEIVMKTPTEPCVKDFSLPNKPFAVADLRFANGADNVFVHNLFKKLGNNSSQVSSNIKDFLAYSAWNTSANSLGSLLLAIKCTLNALNKNTFNQSAFNELMLTRFLDDWAYQANVRQILITPNLQQLNAGMQIYENFLKTKFPTEKTIKYSFPWNRLFEVEIELI